ncbi:hypothetical protein MBLNU230_g1219t1 [Neophaeotheca triangularis]
MGKKRSRTSNSNAGASKPPPEESSRKRIKTFEDVADSDDEFHLNRDKLLLEEEPDAKRRRKVREDEEFIEPEEEEVLGYSEPEEDEDDSAEEDGRYARQDSDGDEGLGGEDDEEDEEEGLAWGTSKEDLYGADEIETEEQALEEEAEALRLQRKQLQGLSAADYGFDEEEWRKAGKEDAKEGQKQNGVVTEVLPQLQIAEDMGPAERLKLLKSRYPEFEPLGKELLAVKETHTMLEKEIKGKGKEEVPNAMAKYRAASAYLGSLTMYFVLLTSTAEDGNKKSAAMSATKLRDHPVMDSLVKCRELWQTAQGLPEDEQLADESPEPAPLQLSNGALETKKAAKKDNKPKKSRAERHADAVQSASAARKAERLARTEADLANLDNLVAPSALKKKQSKPTTKPTNPANDDDSDLGEEAPLTASEAAAKAQHKKSLRFYTSQIAQKANKRGAAGRNAGGDDDIPHRERLRDRQARLNAEAEKRGNNKKSDLGDDLGGESDEGDAAAAREIRDNAGAEDEDGYYDLVASRTAKKKSEKVALAQAQREAALTGGHVVPEEIVGADGKRKISYAIEKNKGLTPHRKKDVRNPRVKKRKRFDEKKKKLASMKPVYKGGEGKGGYKGELTGIKGGLVKSTKL